MKTEKYDHLDLVTFYDSARKGRRGFGYKMANRDPKYFYKTTTRTLIDIKKQHKINTKKFSKYFDPNLIFKIKLMDSVHDASFRQELNKVGIKTIASSNKHGYWVTFTDDIEFKKFINKLKIYPQKTKPTFIDMIESISLIPDEDKLGESLSKKPIQKNKSEYVDVEVWMMEDKRLTKFISGLTNLVNEMNGVITDKMITDNFCVLRIQCDNKLLLEMLKMPEIFYIERPLHIKFEDRLDSDIGDFEINGTPPKTHPGILIVDSGVRDHPLIKDAIADKIVCFTADEQVNRAMNIGDGEHGTSVSSIALYGNIMDCIQSKKFTPNVWIYSAQIMYEDKDGSTTFNRKLLIERQLQDAIERTINNHRECRIINISFGDSHYIINNDVRQFRIASLIDELSVKYDDILFTISAGNLDYYDTSESYLNQFTNDDQNMRLIDPATSVHGITVGSIFPQNSKSHSIDIPSQFTRIGPGLNDMIKPELVEYGGSANPDLITLNPDWISQGRLFTLDNGTSLSAPKIAHYLARLKIKFPRASRNLLKVLLLSSASIPRERPSPFNVIYHGENNIKTISNVYGYGKADLNRALYSESNRVLLKHEGKIQLNHVQLFSISLPKEFITEKGTRTIEITLAFDPPINKNIANYIGLTMEYRLFKNSSENDVRKIVAKINNDAENTDDGSNNQICTYPGIRIRNKNIHQKSFKQYNEKPKIYADMPLILAVTCKKNWYDIEEYRQKYAVSVTIKHDQKIDLYNKIRLKNTARVRTRDTAHS